LSKVVLEAQALVLMVLWRQIDCDKRSKRQDKWCEERYSLYWSGNMDLPTID
jgi:hypothetical protein